MSDDRTCPGSHTTTHPAPALRPDEYLCRSCVHHTERILGDIPALIRDLTTTVTRQARAYRAGGNRSGQTPEEDWKGSTHALAPHAMPADVTASQRGRDTCELLFEWADFVASWHREHGLPIFARYRPLTETVPPAVSILLRHADWLRTNEQGPDLANALRCIRRDLRNLVDSRPERLYAGPCQADLGYPPELDYDCRLPLHRQWGSDNITCDGHKPNTIAGEWTPTGCGHTHSVTDRTDWLRAEVEGQLLPLRLVWESLYVLIPGCDVEWETAKQWARERRQRIETPGQIKARIVITPPRLEPQGWASDTPLYRGSDVLRLAEDARPRRGRRRSRRGDVA